MTVLRLRRTVHRGSVVASGVALDTGLVGEGIARERVLGLSHLGTEVFRLGSVLILRFREPVRLSCDASIGAPLVRYGRLLSAAPLEAKEQETLETSTEAALFVTGGVATVVDMDTIPREDILSWIDVSEFEVVQEVEPLGEVVAEPQQTPIKAPDNIRKSLGLAPPMEGAEGLVQALVQRNPAPSSRRGLVHALFAAGRLLADWRPEAKELHWSAATRLSRRRRRAAACRGGRE